MKDGDRFNPYRIFRSAFLPAALIANRELSAGAKLLWAVIARHAGKNAQCFTRQDTLAAELGTTIRSVKRHQAELQKAALIDVEFRGRVRLSHYYFLWNSAFESDLVIPVDEVPILSPGRPVDQVPKMALGELPRGAKNGHTKCHFCPDEVPKMALAYKEVEVSPLSESIKRASEREDSGDENAPLDRSHSAIEIIKNALTDSGVKIRNDAQAEKLLELTASTVPECTPEVLAEFVRFKADDRGVEVSSFFLRSIPEDLPAWLKRTPVREAAARLQPGGTESDCEDNEGAVDRQQMETTGAVPKCQDCANLGYVVHDPYGPAVSRDYCTCPAGEHLRAEKGESWPMKETKIDRELYAQLQTSGKEAA